MCVNNVNGSVSQKKKKEKKEKKIPSIGVPFLLRRYKIVRTNTLSHASTKNTDEDYIRIARIYLFGRSKVLRLLCFLILHVTLHTIIECDIASRTLSSEYT